MSPNPTQANLTSKPEDAGLTSKHFNKFIDFRPSSFSECGDAVVIEPGDESLERSEGKAIYCGQAMVQLCQEAAVHCSLGLFPTDPGKGLD